MTMRLFAGIALFFISFTCYAQTGNIGIGTNTPQAQLHTTGSIRFDTLAGAGKRMIYADASGNLIAAQPVFKNETTTAIPDNDCTGVTSSIMVTGQPEAVSSSAIKVKFTIIHNQVNDLTVSLITPGGGTLVLAKNVNGANYSNSIFSDGANQLLTGAAAPFTGTFKPMGGGIAGGGSPPCPATTGGASTFGSLNGGTIVPNGQWKLWVTDRSGGNVGQLLNWSISFDGSEPGSTRPELPSTINIDGINTTNTATANMIPAAYGLVYSNATTAVSSSSNNSTLSHPSTGVYVISFTSANLSGLNVGALPFIISLYGSSPGFISHTGDNGKVTVYTYNSSGQPTDRGFSFTLYKP